MPGLGIDVAKTLSHIRLGPAFTNENNDNKTIIINGVRDAEKVPGELEKHDKRKNTNTNNSIPRALKK